MRARFLLGMFSVAMLATPGLQAQSGPPPEVYSANSSADYSTTIAQGSLFVVFGYNLESRRSGTGLRFPLPNVLAGTSVTVQSGSTTLNSPMIYTSNAQVAAILPSNTPVGVAVIAVALNGVPGYSSAEVTVAASSEGLFTTTSSGLGAGIFTALDGSLKTLSNAAKPGEIVTAWGPASDRSARGQCVADRIQLSERAGMGGRAGGAGGLCGALRLLRGGGSDLLKYPRSVQVGAGQWAGGISSNAVTMPVMTGGGACSDAGPTLPPALTKAASGQPVGGRCRRTDRAGRHQLLGGSGGGGPFSYAPRQSSGGGRGPVDPRLRVRKRRAIRLAMAKYAARWKALDARPKLH